MGKWNEEEKERDKQVAFILELSEEGAKTFLSDGFHNVLHHRRHLSSTRPSPLPSLLYTPDL